jgi:hypothetical protein
MEIGPAATSPEPETMLTAPEEDDEPDPNRRFPDWNGAEPVKISTSPESRVLSELFIDTEIASKLNPGEWVPVDPSSCRPPMIAIDPGEADIPVSTMTLPEEEGLWPVFMRIFPDENADDPVRTSTDDDWEVCELVVVRERPDTCVSSTRADECREM